MILVGDQMRLSRPIRGSHSGLSGLSALEHLLDGARDYFARSDDLSGTMPAVNVRSKAACS
jgi:hypothetical protein